jgi:hypothetical protein
MRLAKILSGGQTLRGGQTLALVQGLAIHRGAPYEIRYADYPSAHSVVDFAGIYVLYLVLAVGLPQPYTPASCRRLYSCRSLITRSRSASN